MCLPARRQEQGRKRQKSKKKRRNIHTQREEEKRPKEWGRQGPEKVRSNRNYQGRGNKGGERRDAEREGQERC